MVYKKWKLQLIRFKPQYFYCFFFVVIQWYTYIRHKWSYADSHIAHLSIILPVLICILHQQWYNSGWKIYHHLKVITQWRSCIMMQCIRYTNIIKFSIWQPAEMKFTVVIREWSFSRPAPCCTIIINISTWLVTLNNIFYLITL